MKTFMEWEYFCDASYYNLLAVRPVGDKSFNSQSLFHVQSEKEAKALAELLNDYADAISIYSDKNAMKSIDEFLKQTKPMEGEEMAALNKTIRKNFNANETTLNP